MGKKLRDQMQVSAFRTVYRILGDNDEYTHKPLLRFITAICRTSDDTFDILLKENPAIITEWVKVRNLSMYIRKITTKLNLSPGDIVTIQLNKGIRNAIWEGCWSTGWSTWIRLRYFAKTGTPCDDIMEYRDGEIKDVMKNMKVARRSQKFPVPGIQEKTTNQHE